MLSAIGNMPLVELIKLVSNKNVRILLKCEFMNPSGQY